MAPIQIVLLVVGLLTVIALIQVVVWSVVLGRLRRLPERTQDELKQAGQKLVRAPERAQYRGGTGSWSKVTGLGVLALTKKQLVFRKVTGGKVDVPLDQIAGVRTDPRFRRRRMGRPHLILELRSGDEVGYLVDPPDAWAAALRQATGKPLAPKGDHA
jgi:hypothetical protein